MADPLAQFRRKPIAGVGTSRATPTGQSDEYVAFDAKDRLDRLRIRRAMAPTRAPGYAYLLDVVYDGPYGTNFVLVFTFMVVLVRGRNLQPVVAALEGGMAEFIQEFDPDRWKAPADPNAPFIESIEVVVKEEGPPISEAEPGGGATKH